MGKISKPTYCWDTCTLLAWIKQEKEHPLADISLVVDEIDKKKANLLIPAPVFSEVFEMDLSAEQREVLRGFIVRSNVQPADLTMPIAQRASELRASGHKERPKRKIKTIDAQIAATALGYEVDMLHALDDDLLKLNGKPYMDGLRILKPIPKDGQKGLC